MRRVKNFFSGFAWDARIYLMTLLGVLFSQLDPLMQTRGHLIATGEWTRVVVSAIVAFVVVIFSEGQGDQQGKAKNIKRRLRDAFIHGVGWPSIIGVGVHLTGIIGGKV